MHCTATTPMLNECERCRATTRTPAQKTHSQLRSRSRLPANYGHVCQPHHDDVIMLLEDSDSDAATATMGKQWVEIIWPA